MSSKDHILNDIRRNKPALQPLPELPDFPGHSAALLPQFQQMVEAGGGTVVTLAAQESPASVIRQYFPHATRIASTVPTVPGTVNLDAIQQPHELETLDLAILRSPFAVAENGALWLPESECRHRIVPFITQHLVLLLDAAALVAHMHEAYQRLHLHQTGFGVFIAGPSKTADIEQSLVIGAQGARSLLVLVQVNETTADI